MSLESKQKWGGGGGKRKTYGVACPSGLVKALGLPKCDSHMVSVSGVGQHYRLIRNILICFKAPISTNGGVGGRGNRDFKDLNNLKPA